MSNEQKTPVRIEPNSYPHSYDRADALDALAMYLEQKLVDAMNARAIIDSNMVEDLRLYNGTYDEQTLAKFKRSKVFIKLTRAKTDAAIGQLDDMLHPNGDKNWGIKPTPVPEVSALLQSDKPVNLEGQQFEFEEGKPVTEKEVAKRKLELIREAAEGMEKEIEDQLVECRYTSLCRTVISDACIVGTGILKGPVVSRKLDRVYVKQEDGNFTHETKESFVPTVEVVRPWDFYPDPSAASIEEAEFVFERRYMSKRQIMKLAHRKGFKAENVDRLIKLSPNITQHKASFQEDVRKLAGLNDALNDSRYETWEYHGPIPLNVLISLGIVPAPKDPKKAKAVETTDVDAVIFYCGGVVLGGRLNLIDYSQDSPYKVFNWAENEACIFGFGLPRMVVDEQAILNTVWRQILDNGSATCGPQIGLNKKHVKPENGSWDIEPFKVWEVNATAADIKQAFSTFEFANHLEGLSAIYQTARVLFDEVSGVPMLQQGEQGQASQTLGGMSMLMNAANTVRRRQVRMWDDGITSPMISDFYHFNMLKSPKNNIKGDYQVDARGTSALLVKETQAQAIANFLSVAGSNPIFQQALQLKSAEILRAWAKTQNLPDSIVPSDDDLRAYQKQLEEQQQGQPQDPALQIEQMRVQTQQQKQQHELQLEQGKAQQRWQEMQFEAGLKLQLAAANERIEMARLAQGDKQNTEKLLTELKKNQAKLDQDWQQFVAEARIKQISGITANFGLGE